MKNELLSGVISALSLVVMMACNSVESDSRQAERETPADTMTAITGGAQPSSGGLADSAGADASRTDASGGRSTSPTMPQVAFTHKMMKPTGENMFASLGYECTTCTFEQHSAIVPPEGWSKGPTQVTAFTSGEMRSRPSFEGVPNAMDFIPEVPGKEYKLIVKNLRAELIERGPNGIVARAEVMRDTVFRFAEGSRVHELRSPDGEVFVLFAYQVDPTNVVIPDFQDPSVLGDLMTPANWTYTSRILDEALVLDVKEVATVLAIRGQTTSTWQLIE